MSAFALIKLAELGFDDLVLRLFDGEVPHPACIDQLLNLACGNRNDGSRADLEAQRDELTATINRLIA